MLDFKRILFSSLHLDKISHITVGINIVIVIIIIITIIIASQGPEVFVLTRATNSSLPETLPSLTASKYNVSFKYIFRHEHLPPNISIYINHDICF